MAGVKKASVSSSRKSSKSETPDSDDARSRHGEKTAGIIPASAFQGYSRKRKIVIGGVCAVIVALALALGLGLGLGLKKDNGPHHKGPNVLVIMTDDQDLHLDSMNYMPNVNKLFGEQGTRYESHYCTVAWCCPSRVNFFTGRAAHNTNVTSVSLPFGGWEKFAKVGLNSDWLPVWINESGIDTYYAGKLLNGYTIHNYAKPAHPQGWKESSFLVDPYTYNYYDSHWTNGETDVITPFKGIHTTDVTQTKALAMLDQAAAAKNQFFMMVTPVAPHEQEIAGGSLLPPVPVKWRGVYDNVLTPRTGNWNPDEPSGASWVYNMPKLNASGIATCDQTYQHRLGNIAAIDDMVGTLVQRLEDHGLLDNTYIIYTTDNGFHIGNHRLLPGKRCPYEEDVNIPLLIRGPDVAQGVNNTITNSHTDMAPTILKMLGLPLRDNFDGAPIAYTKEEQATSTKNEIVTVEFWTASGKGEVTGKADSKHPIGLAPGSYYNNTYKAIRLMGDDYSFYYSVWCTGEHEFYDMKSDVVQMKNLLGPNATSITSNPTVYYSRPVAQLIPRLDALLMVTKSCAMDTCRNPWSVLFPGGQVNSLKDAMTSNYDAFFTNQPQVKFEECTNGYIEALEEPFNVNAFSGSQKPLF